MTGRAAAAYDWLMSHNPIYRRFLQKQRLEMEKAAAARVNYIPTAELLLNCHGIEVSIFPTLYPWEVYSDSAVRDWALGRGLVQRSQQPSAKKTYLRKVHSGCRAYADGSLLADLSFLLYDMTLAQSITAKLAISEQQGITADVATVSMCDSESYWRMEQDILCDIVRQHAILYGADQSFPNVFITVAVCFLSPFLLSP